MNARAAPREAPPPHAGSYAFERRRNLVPKTKSRRAASDAAAEWRTLLAKICGDRDAAVSQAIAEGTREGAKNLKLLLERWAIECALNIAWYERKKAWRRAIWIAANVLVLLVSTAGMAGAVVLALAAYDPTRSANAPLAIAAILGFALAAVLGVIRLFAGVADVKAQYGIFWEASAALKRDLYGLEDAWSARTSEDPTIWDRDAIFVELRAALREQIRRAREALAKEQAAFFLTFRSPLELVDAASQSLDALDARAQQLLARSSAGRGGPQGGGGVPVGAGAVLDRIQAEQRAAGGVTEVQALQVELDRLRFVRTGRGGSKDASLDEEIAAKELQLAHARERVEMSRAAVETPARV